MKKTDVLALRLKRHFLDRPLEDETGYTDLFRRCQPVSTLYFTRPGAPPTLSPRTVFDDSRIVEPQRANRSIVKGRFQGGNIGYVLAEDLELYATAFAKPLTSINETQEQILDALRSCGPLPPRAIKDETGILNKHIMPALHRLQTAFVVYEDQSDEDWERPWCLFEDEWPDIVIDPAKTAEATAEVIARFLRLNVFATKREIRDWSRLPVKRVEAGLNRLIETSVAREVAVEEMEEGYTCDQDIDNLAMDAHAPVHMLHRADPLVRAHVTDLNNRFGKKEILQYLLINGEVAGAVIGHWRFRPYDVEDIRLDVPDLVKKERKDEIIAVVATGYHPPNHHILAYGGKKL